MKLRYLTTISTKYVPTSLSSSNTISLGQYLGMSPTYYTKQEEKTTVLQFYDEEFSQWVDVPTVIERKGEK